MNGGGRRRRFGRPAPTIRSAWSREFGAAAGRRRAGARRSRTAAWSRNAERKALDALGLEADATTAEIKARFKALVKRHHPDANGGDRSTEDRCARSSRPITI